MQSSICHYLIQHGKLSESIIKEFPVEKWVEISLICDLSKCSQDGPITLTALDQSRSMYGSFTAEKLLYDLEKFQFLPFHEIDDIITWIMESGTWIAETSKEPDWLYKLKYNWIKLKLEESSSRLGNLVIDLLAKSKLDFKTVKFLIQEIESRIKHEHFTQLVNLIVENNLTGQDLRSIIQKYDISNYANDTNFKSYLHEIQATALLKGLSQVDQENLSLLRKTFIMLLEQHYSFSKLKELANRNVIDKSIPNFVQIVQLISDYEVGEETFYKIINEVTESETCN